MFNAVENAKTISTSRRLFSEMKGGKLADMLPSKAIRNVQVNIIYDSRKFRYTRRFRSSERWGHSCAGIQSGESAKFLWRRFRDGNRPIAITGKFSSLTGKSSQEVSASAAFIQPPPAEKRRKKKIPWRDTDIQIEACGGRVANSSTLGKEKGPHSERAPQLKEGGGTLSGGRQHAGSRNRITFIMYVSAITFRRVGAFNSYFVPDNQAQGAH
jgi:hypothetical protein